LREVALVEAVRQGDDQATKVLLGKVEPLVSRVLTRLGGQRAAQEKEDYVNDLWVPRGSAPPRLDNFHGRAPLGSWVEPVVTRLWFDQRRKQEREPVIDLNDQVQPGTASTAGASVHYGECINQIVQGFVEIADTHEDREHLLV
jgi:DNA-directed RNA polymerase specialized sigma24 family protein